MKHTTRSALLRGIFGPLAAAAIILCFLSGITNLSQGHTQEGKQQLEDALRQAAVACYATEGFYPPSVDYLQAHYGLQIDDQRFIVRYIAFAENLMPDITVLEIE